jgi:N-acetylmuramic acid 6-phosphate etherase
MNPFDSEAMTTEDRNPRSQDLDLLSSLEIARLINSEDHSAAAAVSKALPAIADAIDAIAARLSGEGRLFYIGSGTSGRLGVLDAVECPPTFGVPAGLIQGVLAGGYAACHSAVEAAEDDPDRGKEDLRERGLTSRDAVVGIAASGTTAYTMGALKWARSAGALTVSLACDPGAPISREADIAIEVDTGPEVLTGSTRMKAGTAQKMVLNMLSTAVMVRLGHVYGNLMINVQPKNRKLQRRALSILREVTSASEQQARAALKESGELKIAAVMLRHGCSAAEARRRLAQAPGLRSALQGE